MEIKIRKPIGFSHIGKKDNQEDAVWPLFENINTNARCVILCDGMGGHEHGELASQTVSSTLGKALTEAMSSEKIYTKECFNKALSSAYDALDAVDSGIDEKKMGTTLTCVCFDDQGVLAAHIGDSRIYQVRPGKGIVYRSSDHSWVNMMVKLGEMTPEEAAHHPKRNIITRAVQPHTDPRSEAEIHRLENIKSGDFFFLCCDGVLEQLTDARLFEILSTNSSDKDKLKSIEKECYGKTRDNFTCYLIPVDNVEGASNATDKGLEMPKKDSETAVNVYVDASNKVNEPQDKPKRHPLPWQTKKSQRTSSQNPSQQDSSLTFNKWLYTGIAVVAGIGIAFAIYYFFVKGNSSADWLHRIWPKR